MKIENNARNSFLIFQSLNVVESSVIEDCKKLWLHASEEIIQVFLMVSTKELVIDQELHPLRIKLLKHVLRKFVVNKKISEKIEKPKDLL